MRIMLNNTIMNTGNMLREKENKLMTSSVSFDM